MIVGNIDNWLHAFAVEMLAIPESRTFEREEVVSKYTEVFCHDYIVDTTMCIDNDDEDQYGMWSPPSFSIIEDSDSDASGVWEEPEGIVDIAGSSNIGGAKWYDPIIWGSFE